MIPPSTQQVLLLQEFGGTDKLAVVTRSVPEPGPGEVLVKVLAASVQFTDVILRQGRYPDLKEKPPLVLGYDLVGEVIRLGPGVTGPPIGQRVADLTMTGSYAQFRTLRTDRVTVVEPALDPAEATTLVLSWMIAYQLLHRDARVERGQRLLVTGAAGAVGQALIVLGRLAGAEVWGASRAVHADLVRALGATHLDSESVELGQVLPAGFDVVFDGIGERGFSRAWSAVGPRGHLSAFGFSAAVKAGAPMAMMGLWLARLWWWNRFSGARSASFVSITSLRKAHPGWFLADLQALLSLLAKGDIHPRVAERIGLAEVAEAHARLERGGLEGKVVLLPNG
jgi:NADPH:quinone reductase-like Zn-dependent oxidoreductase